MLCVCAGTPKVEFSPDDMEEVEGRGLRRWYSGYGDCDVALVQCSSMSLSPAMLFPSLLSCISETKNLKHGYTYSSNANAVI